MKTYIFPVEIEQEEDGRWSASVPSLPGFGTWGYTRDELWDNLQHELRAFLDVMLAAGDPVPGDAEVAETPRIAVLL